jgi:hypothetical protein
MDYSTSNNPRCFFFKNAFQTQQTIILCNSAFVGRFLYIGAACKKLKIIGLLHNLTNNLTNNKKLKMIVLLNNLTNKYKSSQ